MIFSDVTVQLLAFLSFLCRELDGLYGSLQKLTLLLVEVSNDFQNVFEAL